MKVRPAPMPARADVAAYAACAWPLAFAAARLYWAPGGTVGPPGTSAGTNPVLFVIDLVAVPLSVVGSLLALSFMRPRGKLSPRRLLLACGRAGGGRSLRRRGPGLRSEVVASAMACRLAYRQGRTVRKTAREENRHA